MNRKFVRYVDLDFDSLRQTVHYSTNPNDTDPYISRIESLTLNTITLYTGDVHERWVLNVNDAGEFFDPTTGQVIYVWLRNPS